MIRVAVAMLGARHHYAVPRLLHKAGLLGHFYTDAYIGNKPWLESILTSIPNRVKFNAVQSLLGRRDVSLPKGLVTSFDMFGLWYFLALKNARNSGKLENVFCESAVRFNRHILNDRYWQDCNVVWGYSGSSLELFREAKNKGLSCIVEQPSNPKPIEQLIVEEEFSRWPDWESPIGTLERKEKLQQRTEEEWALADRIIAGSSFVAKNLLKCGVPETKVSTVPYGIDLDRFCPNMESVERKNDPLRVLFVGRVSVMKGVPYLLEALLKLGPRRVQSRFVGSISLSRDKLDRFSSVAEFLGPVPRPFISSQYQWADVFCFPSLTEGSATVTYEALASGLPVITTPNSGSVIRDGIDGCIVPIRDSEAIAFVLEKYNQNRSLLVKHRAATLEGRVNVGLDKYGRRLEEVLDSY